MIDVSKEVGETTRSFFGVMSANPLSLSLVVVVFALSFMLYFSSAATLEQRAVMAKMIIEWQQQQQVILAGCVSADVTSNMLNNMQKITETMLTYNNAEIKRMQDALDKERDRSFRLRELQMELLAKPPPAPTPPVPPQPEKQGLPKWLPLDGVEWQLPTVQAFPEHELFKMPP
jgi:hypothetical protein